MKSKLILVFILVLITNCSKIDEPCTTFPCNQEEEYYSRNRVAFQAGFRIGTWVSIEKNKSNPDTIVFHTETIWSNYNKNGGIINGKYEFENRDIASYMDYSGNVLDIPYKYRTYYNDTTGILLIQRQANWDQYLKIN